MVFVSRAGEKLEYALKSFKINPVGFICADFGSNTGGFIDCLLQNGAKRVYAIERGYGVLAWKLRNDPGVIVMERTNAMHVELPELLDLVTIDTAWTRLDKTLSNAIKHLKQGGFIIALLKPHYEAETKLLRKGKLPEEHLENVVSKVKNRLPTLGVNVEDCIESPILGGRAENKEYLLLLSKK